ncbi:MAG: T9SS type A sorting domain-containing protein [Prolixibacteraceae bacterium]|jgi:pectate lyase|nr:T9SS type A sorting domain-containing protein [Prolixibacteraceae bacterium]
MKYFLSLFLFLSLFVLSNARSVSVLNTGGWFESAFVEWEPVEGADRYNVYCNGEGVDVQLIDGLLVRDYGEYFRADVPGLKAGTYTITVVPVVSGEETEGVITGELTVMPHDRTGFAFSNGHIPGAYNADGTLKDNAVVIYITENSKNTVSLDVNGANSNPCVGLQMILDGFKKGRDNRPLVVRLIGQVTDPGYLNKGDIVIENDNNDLGCITFEGIGGDAIADGWGIRVKNASNIEIRNIALMNCNSDEGDDISLQQDNEYVWVHHCDFFYGNAGGDSDQAKGDGALDCKRSGYVTISYNHFWDTGKSNLLGNGIEEPRLLTYHHNWYDHSDSRHPRIRNHSVHVFNNYYDGNSKYGVGATNASSVFVEANYFRNCKYPILTSMQGSDVYDEDTQSNDYSDMPTFSKEDGGSIKAYNNYMTGQRRFVAYGDEDYPNSTVNFDAYIASIRTEAIGSLVVSAYGENVYNNFDTDPNVMYEYAVDSPEEARDKVVLYAGRMNGGDFKWAFNNAVDDELYAVNSELKAALVNYETTLLAVQDDGIVTPGDDDNNNDDPGVITGDVVHNFTTDGLSSSYFNIAGNLSDSKGAVAYDGEILTQCLKIESSTLIEFTTSEQSELTLVFNEDFNEEIKVDGTSYTVASGILTLSIESGEHTISKDDVANLYLMSIEYSTGVEGVISETGMKVFPNPVSDILHISTSEKVSKINLYSAGGLLMKHYNGDVGTINLTGMQQGVYFLMIHVGNTTYIKRVVKM